jgi:poly-gamma-glutamate capsule biosynthesis protein CapA/YwtB (metallophosphatase superfamily)
MNDPTGNRRSSIGLVGDLMLKSPLASLRKSDDSAFDAAIEALQQSDLVIANLEMPLSRRGSKMFKYANLRSDPEIIEDVRAMGIHAVSLANNHMMDYGPEALEDTLAACDQAGIARSGAGMNLSDALAPAILEADGKSVALISVSSTLPIGSEAYETMPGIAPIRVKFSLEVDTNLINEQPGTMPVVHTWAIESDVDRVCQEIAAAAERADYVVVAIHWGVPGYWLSPYQGPLATYQQPLGRTLLDAGANIVLGHHAHALHGVEVYNGKPIFYSAGNFLFEGAPQRGFMEPESLIVQITLGERTAIDIVPLWIDERGLPTLATGDQTATVLTKLARLSQPFGTEFAIRDGRGTLIVS